MQELAALVGGQFVSGADGAKAILGAAAIADAGEGHVTFFGNGKYLLQLKASRATAALVPLDFSEDIPAVAIRVENPSLAFAQLLEKFAPEPIRFAPGVHPTAVLGRDVVLGERHVDQRFVVADDAGENADVALPKSLRHQ